MITYSELILLNNDVVQNVETLLNLSDRKAGIELMMNGKAWDCNLTAQREVLRVAAYDLHKEDRYRCENRRFVCGGSPGIFGFARLR